MHSLVASIVSKGKQMNKLVLATGNKYKIREIKNIIGHKIQTLETLQSLNLDSPEETESTYEGNAAIKAVDCAKKTNLPSIADDSGIEVRCLNWRPGVYAARYAPTQPEKVKKLWAEMAPFKDKYARYVAVIAFARPGHETLFFRSELEGVILDAPRGSGGFDYDGIFYVPSMGKTMGELSPDEKNCISHRGGALRKFLSWLETGAAKES